MLEQLLGGDLITQAATVAITGFIGWGAALVKRKFGIEVEAKHRQALHDALLNGAKLAIGRGLTGPAAVGVAVNYAHNMSPGIIKYFGAKAGQLDEIAESKIQELTGLKVDLPLDKVVTRDNLKELLDDILSKHQK